MSFRDFPIQQRIDYLRNRHGKQLKVGFVHYGIYGLGQGIWADWGNKNCNLTEVPEFTVAVIDEKFLGDHP